MERLTEELQIGPFAALRDKAEAVPGAFGTYDCFYAHEVAVTKLKQYEDTGLEPEEVKKIYGLLAEVAEDRNCHFDFLTQCVLEVGKRIINAPLTLEELREMDLFEWLWIEVIRPTERQVFRKIESAYYQVFEDYTAGKALCCGWPGLIHKFEYMDYGKTWLAYRHKPEEVTT